MAQKEIIETIVNTSALALTSFGVLKITTTGGWEGYAAVTFGMLLEFVKYFGRRKRYW